MDVTETWRSSLAILILAICLMLSALSQGAVLAMAPTPTATDTAYVGVNPVDLRVMTPTPGVVRVPGAAPEPVKPLLTTTPTPRAHLLPLPTPGDASKQTVTPLPVTRETRPATTPIPVERHASPSATLMSAEPKSVTPVIKVTTYRLEIVNTSGKTLTNITVHPAAVAGLSGMTVEIATGDAQVAASATLTPTIEIAMLPLQGYVVLAVETQTTATDSATDIADLNLAEWRVSGADADDLVIAYAPQSPWGIEATATPAPSVVILGLSLALILTLGVLAARWFQGR